MGNRLAALGYGAACHGLFAVGIAAMVGNLYGGMQWGPMGFTGAGAWAWDGLLLAQFPILHSLLLTKRGGAMLRRLAPSGTGATLDTTLFAAVASLQVLAMFALWAPLSGPVLNLTGVAWVVMTAGFVAGWALLTRAMSEAGMGVQTGSTGWTAMWRGERPRYPKGFATEGLHSRCRHPIYAAFALILWTGPVWSVDRLLLAVPMTAYCIFGPRLKEARQRKRHGAAYAAYARRTPALLPISARR
ncbi:MAG: protein-S-isoprenylcysteine O-methyltransferase Ste14 [Myxococcota bacterium]|jgi:protein-S-isoprenylcysteine O-methyltransferase Ste14